jgi:hypothetical protein
MSVLILALGMVFGAVIVVAIWALEQKNGAENLMACRKNMYWGTPVGSDGAELARIALLSSAELQKMLDFLIAQLSDTAALEMVKSNASDAGYGPRLAEAAGMSKAAGVLADALENLKSGEMVKEIAQKEQAWARGKQI